MVQAPSTRVSADDLDVAIAWLEVNEGEAGEAESCHRVAAWLRAEIDRRQLETALRQFAREQHLTPAQVRQLRQRLKTDPTLSPTDADA